MTDDPQIFEGFNEHESLSNGSAHFEQYIEINGRLFELWVASNGGMAIKPTGKTVSPPDDVPWVNADSSEVEAAQAAIENGADDDNDH